MTMKRSSGEESITIFFKQKKFRVFIVQIELKQLRGALILWLVLAPPVDGGGMITTTFILNTVSLC